MNLLTRRVLLAALCLGAAGFAQPPRWSEAEANDWYAKQPWLVGANYIPSTAINQLEMWQADTFNPARIEEELGWAHGLGMNTMRVFLHDLLWQQDPEGFRQRIDQFLAIAERQGIRPVFVLFDSCWDPAPKLGKQRDPRPGVHNSGWVQSPGRYALSGTAQHARLQAYVKGVIGAFAQDSRILAWDLWNEPDNVNRGSYFTQEPSNKVTLVNALLPNVFTWARSAKPSQPLTSGVWQGDWSSHERLSATARIQIENSDVISFHSYDHPTEFEKKIVQLERYNRPLLCTEYMARGNGSFFQGSLPVGRAHDVAMINWGLVAGKTQTFLPWDSWQRPYDRREPSIWFHEVFDGDGRPYQAEEMAFIRRMIKEAGPKRKAAAGK